MEHNHHQVYVQKVILWADHKPLVSISQKPWHQFSKHYSAYSTAVASTIWLRDILQAWQGEAASWYPVKSLFRGLWAISHRIRGGVHPCHSLPVPDHQLKELQREMACDPTLQFLKKAILDGFPDTKEKQPAAIHQYFEIRDELSVHGGVIFKGQRCIITQTLRQKIKQRLHNSHIGLQGCLCRTQETVYWPGMNAKITDYIQKCDVCMSLQKNQTKERLSRAHIKALRESWHWHIHTRWQELSLHSNYYSRYFEVDQLHGKTGTVIIKKLKKHFVTHGKPNELLSGNEPPFNSAEFKNFLRSSGTAHVTSSLGYPQSNERVENAFKTAKSLIKKVKATGADYFFLLLSWRNTPMEGLSTSPAWRMFGQRMRTHLQGALAIGERQDSQNNATSPWQEPDMVQSRNRRTSRCAIL